MADEVPVHRTDLLALLVLSLGGGLLIATVTASPGLSPQFISSILFGTMLLAFFLFVPIMGMRLFIDDWRTDEGEDAVGDSTDEA